MKFSIIVPSYNQGAFIQRTLDSITTQKGVELEVLVFDGGSKDETVSILKQQPPMVQWISRPDRGQTDAINQGLYQATGDIIAYLNSDDVYYPGALQRVLEHFEANPGTEILYGNGDHIDAEDNLIEHYYNEPWSFDRLVDICYICQPAAFWRRSVIERFGYFDDQLHYAMDYDYWLRVGRHIDLHYLSGPALAGSRLYRDNKTMSQRVPVHKEILTVALRHAHRPPYRWLKTLAHIYAAETISSEIDRSAMVVTYVESVIRYADEFGIFLDARVCEELERDLGSIGQ